MFKVLTTSGSEKQGTSPSLDLATATGTLVVPRGGTGATTLTGVLQGNGTSAITAIAIPADATQFLNGTGAFSVPASGSDWTTTTTKSADQDVTASAALVDCTDLVIAVTSGDMWIFQLLLLYSGSSATGDFKCNFTFPSTCTTIHRYMSIGTADTAGANAGIINLAVTAWAAAIALGCDASDTVRPFLLDMILVAAGTGNVQFQFAQNMGTAATHARVKQGSIFRGKKVL